MYPSKSSVASAHDEIHGTIEKFRHFINVFCRRHAISVLPIVKNGFRNMQFAVTERVTAFMEMLKQKSEALGKRQAGRKFLSFLIIFRGCEVIQRALKAIRYLDQYFDFRYPRPFQITGNRGFGKTPMASLNRVMSTPFSPMISFSLSESFSVKVFFLLSKLSPESFSEQLSILYIKKPPLLNIISTIGTFYLQVANFGVII